MATVGGYCSQWKREKKIEREKDRKRERERKRERGNYSLEEEVMNHLGGNLGILAMGGGILSHVRTPLFSKEQVNQLQ